MAMKEQTFKITIRDMENEEVEGQVLEDVIRDGIGIAYDGEVPVVIVEEWEK
jgi:hypothetical protein